MAVALKLGLFDNLEESRTPTELACALHVEARGLAKLCNGLLAAGRVRCQDTRLCNSELASMQLCKCSPS